MKEEYRREEGRIQHKTNVPEDWYSLVLGRQGRSAAVAGFQTSDTDPIKSPDLNFPKATAWPGCNTEVTKGRHGEHRGFFERRIQEGRR